MTTNAVMSSVDDTREVFNLTRTVSDAQLNMSINYMLIFMLRIFYESRTVLM